MRSSAPSDVLRWPLVGPFLRWRHARTALQLVLLCVASVLVLHGLLGTQVAPANLATVLSWVQYPRVAHHRAAGGGELLLHRVSLRSGPRCRPSPLEAGATMAALASRQVDRHHAARRRSVHVRALRSLGVPPRHRLARTGYFAAALTIDLLFTGATFCKYICPIGQFSFVASTMSPLEVQVRQPGTCRTCRTVDCIKGRRDAAVPARIVRRGCELSLFLPAKVGNLDCTLCLDCVHACPHDNVAIATRLPALELVDARRRSGIGWLSRRRDIAALALVFVFGGLVNALGMTAAARAMEQGLAQVLGARTEGPVLAALFALVLVGIPLVLMTSAAAFTALVTGKRIASLPGIVTGTGTR